MFPPTLKWCAFERIDVDADGPMEEGTLSAIVVVVSCSGTGT
jgi:hypothetical protein